ncbi:glycosyltransferase [Geomonas sp. RF6]|uniref:glycosyltransferase family 2 protein n=1 Tax=Geomonas sp. RF6 TaxID=2897342 RepID=UPI001E2FB96C|nr:glycosyltransferase [Geomonas sp. RF6]UFS71307.1 glycosyltransferase [Geomonas sp. RF6]
MTGAKRPEVSICIPTYNSAAYLRESLDSIAAQTYRSAEVIISDNASTDDTTEIAAEYAALYGWRLHINRENLGPFGNFNALIGMAAGRYVAIYHADDVYHRSIVEESLAVFRENPGVMLVGALSTEIDGNGSVLKEYRLPPLIEETGRSVHRFEDVLRGVLTSGRDRAFLITPTVMVRREAYEKLGTFSMTGRYGSAGDYEMWLRIARSHQISIINKRLLRYRIHAGQGSELEIRRYREIPDVLGVVEEYVAALEDETVRALAKRYRFLTIFHAALRQNRCGDFERCRASLERLGAHRSVAASLLGRLNRHGVRDLSGVCRVLNRALPAL